MKIVIDMDEHEYKEILKDGNINYLRIIKAIKNGTPLPKGHGRLIDADKLKHAFIKCSKAVQGSFTDFDIAGIVCDSPTIIEADGGGE